MRRVRTFVVCAFMMLGLGLSATGAEKDLKGKPDEKKKPSPGQQFQSLWDEYKKLSGNQDEVQKRRRMRIVREMGDVDCPSTVKRLWEIFERDPFIRVRIHAMHSLCKRGDLEIVERMVKRVAQEFSKPDKDDFLPLCLGDALAHCTDPEIGPWLAAFQKRVKNPDVRLGIIEGLRELAPAGAREELLKLLHKYRKTKMRPYIEISYETIRALGRIGGKGVREVLIAQAVHEKDVWRRLAAAQVLTIHWKDPEVIKTMQGLLADKEYIVREAAAQCVGRTKCEPLFNALLDLLADEQLRVMKAAHDALVMFVGEDLGFTPAPWVEWKRGKTGNPDVKEPTGAAGNDGVEIFSNRVLFMMDISQSMKWPDERTHSKDHAVCRLRVAKSELIRLVRTLDIRTRFNVLTFASYANPWLEPKGRRAVEVEGSEKNIQTAVAWIEKQKNFLYTNLLLILEKTLEKNPQVDTFYLFCDGSMPLNDEYDEPEELLAKFRRLNRTRRVIVHSVFLMWGPQPERFRKHEDPDDHAEYIRLLAEQSGGTYREFRAPPPEFIEIVKEEYEKKPGKRKNRKSGKKK